jgi:hypothetical protein
MAVAAKPLVFHPTSGRVQQIQSDQALTDSAGASYITTVTGTLVTNDEILARLNFAILR